MANRFLAGFDDHDTAGLAYEWTVGAGATVVTGLTGQCLTLTNCNNAVKAGLPAAATYTFGFRVKLTLVNSTISSLFMCGDSSKAHVILCINPDGTLYVGRSGQAALSASPAACTLLGNSTTVFLPGVVHYVEIKVTVGEGTSGSVEVRLDGSETPEINVPATDTQNGGTATISTLCFAGTVCLPYIDDVYANDNSGTECTGFMGDMRVDSHLASVDGAHTDWTPSTGTDHFAVVDDNPQNVADYVSTLTQDAMDTFQVEDFKNNGADIKAIQLSLLVSKAAEGTAGIAGVLRESGSDTVGTTVFPSTSWTRLQQNYSLAEADPKVAAAGFNACEWGIKRTTA